jgi:hypothetical protein
MSRLSYTFSDELSIDIRLYIFLYLRADIFFYCFTIMNIYILLQILFFLLVWHTVSIKLCMYWEYILISGYRPAGNIFPYTTDYLLNLFQFKNVYWSIFLWCHEGLLWHLFFVLRHVVKVVSVLGSPSSKNCCGTGHHIYFLMVLYMFKVTLNTYSYIPFTICKGNVGIMNN